MDENEEFFISGSEDGDIKVSVNGITWFEYNRVLMRQAHGKMFTFEINLFLLQPLAYFLPVAAKDI